MRRTPSAWRRCQRHIWLAILLAPSAPTIAAELKGQLQCSAAIGGASAYAQPLTIQLEHDYGMGVMETADLLENQELVLSADGTARYNAIGLWKNQPARRWRIHARGQVQGSAVQLTGTMVANTAAELVRPECNVRLEANTPIRLPAPQPSAYRIDTVGAPLGVSPSSINGGAVFREWGLERGLPWSARVPSRPASQPIGTREPSTNERKLIADATEVVVSTRVKAMVLVDDGRVVAAIAKPYIQPDTLLPGASMSKTVTALGVGKAICTGRLRLDAQAGTLVAGLQDTDIGKATLRHILWMSSGSGETATQHTHGITYEETRQHLWNADSSVQTLVASPRISKARSGKTGYDYKSTDPYLAALMAQHALGTPFVQWLQETVFQDAGLSDALALDTDRQGNFLATGGVRLSLSDWIRLAVYIQQQRDTDTCFGQFVRDMGQAQIGIPKIPGVNGYFNGYGYFTWADNDLVANTAWAVGHYGQRIGWSTQRGNKRLFLTFGDGSDADMARIYPLARRWIQP